MKLFFPIRSDRWWLAAVAALLAGSVHLAAAGQSADEVIHRRGVEGPIRGEIVDVSDAGISLKTSTGAQHRIPWDRIRSVDTSRRFPRMDAMLRQAEDMWRARTRLERRDATLAEPLFERLFESYRGSTSESSLIVSEGLLRCRLFRSGNAEAVIEALEVARLRRAGVAMERYSGLPEVYDDTFELCTWLPPFWTTGQDIAALQRVYRELENYSSSDPIVSAMATLYRRAIQNHLRRERPDDEVDDSVDEVRLDQAEPDVANHRGVALLQLIVEADAASISTRRTARQRLEQMRDNLPAWAQSWADAAIARSLLHENARKDKQAGLVSLSRVIVLSDNVSQHYLIHNSMLMMIDQLEALGDHDGAAQLRNELARRFPRQHGTVQVGAGRSARQEYP